MPDETKKRGGARPGAGRKPKAKAPTVRDKDSAAKILAAIFGPRPHEPAREPKDDCKCELCWWWDIAHSKDFNTRSMIWKLYEKRDGKAVHTVNHLHDKPIDLNVNMSLSERFRVALEKGEKRVRELRS